LVVAVYFIYIGVNILIFFFKVIAQVFVKILNSSFTSKTWNSVNKQSSPTPPNNDGDANIHTSPQEDEGKKKEQRAKWAKSARESRARRKANATQEEAKANTIKGTLKSREKRAKLYEDPDKHELHKIKHAASERINRPIRLEKKKLENPNYKPKPRKNNNSNVRATAERARLKLEDTVAYQALLDREKKSKTLSRANKKRREAEQLAAEILAAKELAQELAADKLLNILDSFD